MNISYPAVVVIGLLFILIVFVMRPLNAAPLLKTGSVAPGFNLLDQNGKQQQLRDYQGKWVVLYFYPKDDTPGCTTEACQFRDDYFQIRGMGAVVLGVSLDDVSSHKAFAEKYHLPFPLLADTDKQVAEHYNVLTGFGPVKFASRQTFIIDPQGRIARHYPKVRPRSHAAEVINDLKELIAVVK